MQLTTPTGRGKEGQEIRWQIVKCVLNKGNPTTLRQLHHFPTSQPTPSLFNNPIPNILGLIGGPQRNTMILQRQRRNTATQNTDQPIHVLHITHWSQFRLI
jgi:hypothetical protein